MKEVDLHMQERHIYEEMYNIHLNQPLESGMTISHLGAKECADRGWSTRDHEGRHVPTESAPDIFTCKTKKESE